jgi:septal ring factor EnvC (AmiA/AmiB activator)
MVKSVNKKKEPTLRDIAKLVTDLSANTDRKIEELAASTKNGFDEVHTRMNKFETELKHVKRKVDDIDFRLTAQISYHEKEHAVLNEALGMT